MQDSSTPIEPTEAAPQTRAPIAAVSPELEAAAALERQLAEFVVPPVWLENVESSWDRAKPWQEARLEIRRLLGIGDQASRREGLRLMWDYRESNNMGDGHEYSMYTYLGGEPLWAILACRELLDREEHAYPPDFGIKSLASLYLERGMLSEAEKTLQRGLDWPPADATWRRAEYLDLLGDLYVAWQKPDEARNYYEQSIQLYPRTNPPYGQHLIPRRIKIIQSKLDILSMSSLEDVVLRDGTWSATVPGYSGDIHVTAQVSQGRLAVIRLRHEEKIDQGSTITVPRQIVERQSLSVDADRHHLQGCDRDGRSMHSGRRDSHEAGTGGYFCPVPEEESTDRLVRDRLAVAGSYRSGHAQFPRAATGAGDLPAPVSGCISARLLAVRIAFLSRSL